MGTKDKIIKNPNSLFMGKNLWYVSNTNSLSIVNVNVGAYANMSTAI